MAKWQKGQSGNPGGRPKAQGDIRELARQHTPKAIGTLVKVMNDENAPPTARVAASTALLDRGWGRPAQTIRATLEEDRQIQIDHSLAGRASDLFNKMRGIENTRGTEKPTSALGSEPSSITVSHLDG
jgi:hypothetical protein